MDNLEIISTLRLSDRLNLALVAGGLLPATDIALSCSSFAKIYGSEIAQTTTEQDSLDPSIFAKISEAGFKRFEQELCELGIFGILRKEKEICLYYIPYYIPANIQHSSNPHWKLSELRHSEYECRKVLVPHRWYMVGHTMQPANKLMNAFSDYEWGVALGYPLEDVNSHVGLSLQLGLGLVGAIHNAFDAHTVLPTWLAYIQHEPRYANFVDSQVCVSEESQKFAIKCEAYIKDRYPDIDLDVQKEFNQRYDKNYSWRRASVIQAATPTVRLVFPLTEISE